MLVGPGGAGAEGCRVAVAVPVGVQDVLTYLRATTGGEAVRVGRAEVREGPRRNRERLRIIASLSAGYGTLDVHLSVHRQTLSGA